MTSKTISDYLADQTTTPQFVKGDAFTVLKQLPSGVIDCCMSSPPYWRQRQYPQDGIGLELSPKDYVESILEAAADIWRVLKTTGSFWLNLGDSYDDKELMLLPFQIASGMKDQGWRPRETVIWHKRRGTPDSSRDKLRNAYEYLFHFTKARNSFYDMDAIRSPPKPVRNRNGVAVSGTGVSGVRYRAQILASKHLSQGEKVDALDALGAKQEELLQGSHVDFRMIIRGLQRPIHSDGVKVSGRAKEVARNGFCILDYDRNGSKPSNVWDIRPINKNNRGSRHFAPYPEELCIIPIRATCPPGGVVLDPWCGTGTTMVVAQRLGRKSIGIELCADYVRGARRRCTL